MASSSGSSAAPSDTPDLTQKAELISAKLFADDGLAIPIATEPAISALAQGLDRPTLLDVGGEYYIAWYSGFLHGLLESGLDIAQLPEMVVGTSAGSYMGSSLLSGHFFKVTRRNGFLG